MTSLSVNINKFALVRNARNQNTPDIIELSKNCLDFGAHGITVHPRPDERHIRYDDCKPLNDLIRKNYPDCEFNIEGYPSDTFLSLIAEIKPHQVTLVPDPPEALTSSFGWDLMTHHDFLKDVTQRIQSLGCRVSLFLDPDYPSLSPLESIHPDCVELYTYFYAHHYAIDPAEAVRHYKSIGEKLQAMNILINAGHDLNQENLKFLIDSVPSIQEVSIGHALVCDTFNDGLKTTVLNYLKLLK